METKPKIHPFFTKKEKVELTVPPPSLDASSAAPPSTSNTTPLTANNSLPPLPPLPSFKKLGDPKNAQAGPSSSSVPASASPSESSLLLPSTAPPPRMATVSPASSSWTRPTSQFNEATALPSFKIYENEAATGPDELSPSQKIVAFDFQLPPSTFLALHEEVVAAPTLEKAAVYAGEVLASEDEGLRFSLAIREGDTSGFMRNVTEASYDGWWEARLFELSDAEGKDRMRKTKLPLDSRAHQEVISLLVSIYPRPASPASSALTSPSERSDDLPPPKKRQRFENAAGVSVQIKQSASKGEVIVVRKPTGKTTITGSNVMSFNRRDRERFGDLIRDQTLEHRIATSSALPCIFTKEDLAKYPLLSNVFDTSDYNTKINIASFYAILPQRKISIEDIEAIYPYQMDQLEKMWIQQGRIRDVLCLASIRARVGLRKSAFRQTEKQARAKASKNSSRNASRSAGGGSSVAGEEGSVNGDEDGDEKMEE